MDTEKTNWPAWFYGPGNASKVCESEADVPAGRDTGGKPVYVAGPVVCRHFGGSVGC
jgi:hypothetical protein